jgi:predicted sulfurtransferase
MNEVMQNLEVVEAEKPVVVYCRAGVRSHVVIERIQEKTGQKNLYNLKGGITNYLQKSRTLFSS